MSIRDAKFAPGTQSAYALSGAGTLSRFHATSNPFAAPVAWNDVDLTEVYTRIVPEINGLDVYVIGESGSVTNSNCADAWSIYTGSETDRTGNTISADAAFGGGQWRIGIDVTGSVTHPPDNFCRHVSVVINTPGISPSLIQGWWNCGEDGETIGLFDADKCIWNLDFIGDDGPFNATFTLTDDDGCGDCDIVTGTATVTQYSNDTGITFGSIQTVGAPPAGGMDVIKIGTVALAGAGSQVFSATSGGVWSIHDGTLPSGAAPTAIFIPRWQFGGTIIGNINTSSPQYLLGSGTLSNSGESLWKVNAGTFTAISPKIGGTAGLIVGPEALKMPWNSGTDILAIADFSGTFKLCVSHDTGAGWRFTDLNNGAGALALRRGDVQIKQAMLTNVAVAGLINDYQAGTVIDYDRAHIGNATNSIDVFG